MKRSVNKSLTCESGFHERRNEFILLGHHRLGAGWLPCHHCDGLCFRFERHSKCRDRSFSDLKLNRLRAVSQLATPMSATMRLSVYR